jgi:D-sedoheptulose 7-phosphate isomerase
MKQFREEYFKKLMDGLNNVPAEDFEKVATILLDAWENNKQVFIFGNGGSAATASHFACDLGKGTLDNVYDMRERRFRVMSLNDNMSMFSALANDTHYDDVFVQQLRHHLEEGDVVIGISASGNSPNVVNALKLAKGMNAKTIGFLGFEGGKMKALCDAVLHFPEKSYQRSEDAHLIFEHLLTSYIYEKKKERVAKKKREESDE